MADSHQPLQEGERPFCPACDLGVSGCRCELAEDLRTINEAAARIDPSVDVLAEMYRDPKAEEA